MDLTGHQYNHWKVLKLGDDTNNGVHWLCQCDCGNIKEVRASYLRNGHSSSCGCMGSKNGLSGTRLAHSYRDMKRRCYSQSDKRLYKTYGERGITVYDEWKNNFMSFYTWAITNGYNDTLTLDRIDVNGNYEPDNCRWITMKEQQNNRRNNVFITIDGVTKTIAQWADYANLKYNTLHERITKGKRVGADLLAPVKQCKEAKQSKPIKQANLYEQTSFLYEGSININA